MEFWPLRPSTTDLRLSIEQTATLLSRTTEATASCWPSATATAGCR